MSIKNRLSKLEKQPAKNNNHPVLMSELSDEQLDALIAGESIETVAPEIWERMKAQPNIRLGKHTLLSELSDEQLEAIIADNVTWE